MSKITLSDVVNLQNETTAVNVINNNSDTVELAFDNTLSRDGTQPNAMESDLDMNSNRVLNLPTPVSNYEPLRVIDGATVASGGSISVSTLPAGGTINQLLGKNSSTNFDVSWKDNHDVISGGTTNQVLAKNSNTNYDLKWTNSVTSVGVTAPSDLTVTGSPVTTTGNIGLAWAVSPTGTGAVVRATAPTISAPVISSITNGGTITIPSGTDTLVGRSTADTLTNKNIDAGQLTGTIASGRMPALTGDITSTVNTVATTLTNNAVSNSKLAQAGAWTLKGNATGSTANVSDFNITGLTSKASPVGTDQVMIVDNAASGALKVATLSTITSVGAVSSIDSKTGAFTTGNGITTASNSIELSAARRTLPTRQVFTSGSGTYTTPSNCLWIRIRMVGGGGGGGGSGSSGTTNGGTGGTTTFSTLSAGGGSGGTGGSTSSNAGGSGGTASGGNIVNFNGAAGQGLTYPGAGSTWLGGSGGQNAFFGGASGQTTLAGITNSGAGGAGGATSTSICAASGGGSGASVEHVLTSPAASYSYAVGAAGTAGTAGVSGVNGTAGGSGIIIVEEFYGS